jgi:hypothetical protein
MWYYSSSQDKREQPPTSEVVAAVEPNPGTAAREEAEPGEPSLSADELPRPTANIPPIRPGSEYWLP